MFEKLGMADTRRRGHPALLTCLMLVATVVVLLQYAWSSNGQAYSRLRSSLVTRPANSALSKLDALTPTKERPLTVFTESNSQPILDSENVTTGDLDKTRHIINSQDVVITRVPEPETSHFVAVEPEGLPTYDAGFYSKRDLYAANGIESVGREVFTNFGESMSEVSVTFSEQDVGEKPNIWAESLEVATDDVAVAYSVTQSGRDLGDGLHLVLQHTPNELIVPASALDSVAPQAGKDEHDSKVMEPSRSESSAANANVQQMLVEAKPEAARRGSANALEISEGNHENLGNSIPRSQPTLRPIAAIDKIPAQVQKGELTPSQEMKEQRGSLPQASPEPKESIPDPIFQELQACKKAINEASQDSADPSLYGGIYKNVAAFSKSYELMEKVFKVYIYRDGRQPLLHTGPVVGIYASEGQFIERMKRASNYLTKDPSQAHMFFLPYSVQHMVENLYVPNSYTMLPLATFIKDYVDNLASRYPFWNRTHGADHFFVSCHDWGPATARDHSTLRTNAMKVVCNADLSEEFVLGKDASLPEVYIHKLKRARKRSVVPSLGGPGWDKRPYLAFFAGQVHGRVRPILLDHWKDKDPDMKIYEVLPKEIARVTSYIQHMKMSKYCICAAGFEVNSPRIVEAIYYDCVPVIIADNFVLPFSEILNWDAFSVTIPESDIPRLKEILTAIPEKGYRSRQVKLRKVRQHFLWHEKPEKYDVFNMILHSVWTSRLNRLEQVRASSSELF